MTEVSPPFDVISKTTMRFLRDVATARVGDGVPRRSLQGWRDACDQVARRVISRSPREDVRTHYTSAYREMCAQEEHRAMGGVEE